MDDAEKRPVRSRPEVSLLACLLASQLDQHHSIFSLHGLKILEAMQRADVQEQSVVADRNGDDDHIGMLA